MVDRLPLLTPRPQGGLVAQAAAVTETETEIETETETEAEIETEIETEIVGEIEEETETETEIEIEREIEREVLEVAGMIRKGDVPDHVPGTISALVARLR